MKRTIRRCFLVVLALSGIAAGNLRAQETKPGAVTKLAYEFLLQGAEFRSETVLEPDGKLARYLFQETALTPKAAQKKDLWKETAFLEEDSSTLKYPFLFSKVAVAQRPKFGDTFFQAYGEFPSIDKLPDHVLLKPAPGSPPSKMVRHLSRTDLVFVTEWTWRETLTEFVAPGKERAILADLAVELLEESIRNTIGKDYDPAELLVWLRKDGKQEIAWWLMELDNKTPKDGDVVKGIEAFLTLLPPRLKKWGLDLDRDIPEKLIAPIAQRVRDKAGKPVSEKTVRSWFDNPEKFYDQLTRCIGKYGARFEYSMTVPGVILETNGGPRPERRGGGMCCRPAPGKKKLAGTLGTSDIHWSFGRSYALASDHAMQVRSLASDVELQRKVFKKVPLESKESALAYRDLVAGQESLLKVLRACREKQSMTPLHDHRAGSGGEEKDRVERLLKILGQ